MRTETDRTHARGGVSKTSMGVIAAALLASAAVMMTPTTAAAFNIQGLIAAAVAHYGGGGGGYHARVHEASRHGHHSSDGDDANAPSAADTKPPEKDQIGAPPHHQYSSRTGTEPTLAYSPTR